MADLQERKRWEPAEAEARIFARWLESGLFHPEPAGSPSENYSIAIPPPNVTGALHMGHALNGSIQDTLIRHTACAASGPSGSSARTTPASPPRRRSSGCSSRRARAARASGARRSSRACGSGASSTAGSSRAVPAPRRVVRLRGGALHARRGLRRARSQGLRRPLREGLIYRDNTWSTGTRAPARRSPTSRWRSARSRTPSTTSTTRSPRATDR